MSNYSKINFIYFMQKWMDSVAGQTFLNYAYSWGAAVVILGTLFKLTHLPGADVMLFLGMGTEVFVFFISAFDRPFDKTTIDMTLDNHMADNISVPQDNDVVASEAAMQQSIIIGSGSKNAGATVAATSETPSVSPAGVGGTGGTVIIGGGIIGGGTIGTGNVNSNTFCNVESNATPAESNEEKVTVQPESISFAASESAEPAKAPRITTPAPAVSQETAEAMEEATSVYVTRLNELNETFEKVAALSARLATDSEEMENLNRTLTGISRVYEMQLKSASQQITTQDEINEQTRKMAQQIQELNAIYARMIEAMTVNMNPLAAKA
ncbi:MAG: gliding motility protein GldL [Prevotella sp.]|nr:gliding motility protein GldL [Candidatus Prevotella equi]